MQSKVIGAKIALFLGARLVVLLRDDKPDIPWPAHWDLPGGGIEPGETPLQCALRELQEETTLELDPGLVTWGRDYGTSSGDLSWFFCAQAPETLAEQLALQQEGQALELWTARQFLEHEKAVPQFKSRLQDVLYGAQSAKF